MVQVQAVGGGEDVRQALLERPVTAGDEEGTGRRGRGRRTVGGWECAKRAYRDGGVRVFWQGIWVCLGRAFLVSVVLLFLFHDLRESVVYAVEGQCRDVLYVRVGDEEACVCVVYTSCVPVRYLPTHVLYHHLHHGPVMYLPRTYPNCMRQDMQHMHKAGAQRCISPVHIPLMAPSWQRAAHLRQRVSLCSLRKTHGLYVIAAVSHGPSPSALAFPLASPRLRSPHHSASPGRWGLPSRYTRKKKEV